MSRVIKKSCMMARDRLPFHLLVAKNMLAMRLAMRKLPVISEISPSEAEDRSSNDA